MSHTVEERPAGEVARWTAAEITAAVRRGEVSRAEVVRAHLDRVAAYDGTLNALTVALGERALAEARAADADPAGREDMPLDGVPISVKDLFDVAGVPTSEGSATYAGRTASADATVVTRLRAAGAFVIGKGNQPDFAMRWNTASGVRGYTRNPRDPAASAGGSSGGDAAAVAAGMAAVGIGTDLAGSVRVPAAFCGLYGLRTTPGLVPSEREFPPRHAPPAYDTMSSVGPLARDPDDLRTALLALAGPHTAHPVTLSAPAPAPPSERPPKVAVVTDECGAAVDAGTVAAVRRTADALRLAGYEVEDAVVPGIDRLPDLWGELIMTEALAAWDALAPHMNESCRTHSAEMAAYFRSPGGLGGFLGLWQERSALRSAVYRWMADYPLVLSPLAGWHGAPPLRYDHLVGATETARIITAMRNALWPPVLGLPAVALPSGVQIAARPFHDLDAVAAARAVGPPVTVADPA